jgi:hypothetical protein
MPGEQTAAFNQKPNETKTRNRDDRQCSGQGDIEARSDFIADAKIRRESRRGNRENGCAGVGRQEGK